MPLLFYIIVFSILGGVLSVLVAAIYLALPATAQQRSMPHMISFATGALLGAAFMSLLPHALDYPGVAGAHVIMFTVLLGILGFFLLEKMVLWRHCHTEECEVHGAEAVPTHEHRKESTGALIVIGDGIHNLVDGVLITAAFLTDIHVGIVTSLAVAAHEIPQEVGDFSILIHSGYSRGKALLLNILSSLATLVGALLAYYSMTSAMDAVPYVLAVAAASFIYIAVADLIPSLHHRTEVRVTLQQIVMISCGLLVMYIAHATLH
jgi:zinc and cadmium transporter